MRVITEVELRDQYKQAEFTSYQLPQNTRLTPSAQQFLNERRIRLITAESELLKQPQVLTQTGSTGGYAVIESDQDTEKPENVTHLNGSYLVSKNHPRIKFRGKLDSLEAIMISSILEVENQGYPELAKDLTEVLDFLRQVMSAEVRERPLAPLTFHGLNPAEIREHSHYPQKYYGVSHILPQPKHGKLMARLNVLRAQSRELELAAMDAFTCGPEEVDRPDIIQALNRLSSLFYLMMIQMCSGYYKVGI